ncbi:C-X-C motif chemokine 17 isoform X2 [Callorhinus ursinus]|uniref:C-X-C motif chemokine 17 isoform X2 n=1 Tax=Callorhinus ursinus TaxID=34884 RepID=UPI003CD02568
MKILISFLLLLLPLMLMPVVTSSPNPGGLTISRTTMQKRAHPMYVSTRENQLLDGYFEGSPEAIGTIARLLRGGSTKKAKNVSAKTGS